MKTKTFDAVKMMRELRDQLSRELESMTPEERSRYVQDKAAWFDRKESNGALDESIRGDAE